MTEEQGATPQTFNGRLCAAMAAMPNPVKDTNAFKYKYETLDQVLSIVQGALMAQGLFAVQGMEQTDGGYELRTSIRDAGGEGGMVVDSRPVAFTGDPQKDGSAETYARRYALKTAFGLCGEDDDGAQASKERYKKPVAARQASKPAPERQAAAPAQDDACPEWHRMVQAVSEYVRITGQPKKDVWERFGARVGKRDAQMCLAVIEDIGREIDG